MSRRRGTDPVLDPALDTKERNELARVARRLETERPVPRPAFRGALGRKLTRELEPHRAAPRRLRLLIGAYAARGSPCSWRRRSGSRGRGRWPPKPGWALASRPVGTSPPPRRVEIRAEVPEGTGEDLLDVGQAQPGQLGDLGTGHVRAEPERNELELSVAETTQRLLELGGDPKRLLLGRFDRPRRLACLFGLDRLRGLRALGSPRR